MRCPSCVSHLRLSDAQVAPAERHFISPARVIEREEVNGRERERIREFLSRLSLSFSLSLSPELGIWDSQVTVI